MQPQSHVFIIQIVTSNLYSKWNNDVIDTIDHQVVKEHDDINTLASG